MLNCHPDIAATPECGFLQWWFKKYGNWTEQDVVSNRLDKYLNDLLTSRKIETWKLDKEKLRKFIIGKHPSSYSELTLSVYQFWGLQNDKIPQVIIDKNNYYIRCLSEIDQVWPDAHYLLLVRDGRDVACSYKKLDKLETDSPYKPSLPNTIQEIANVWKYNHEVILKFLHRKGNTRYVTIKYEDLVMRTQQSLERICQFLDISFSNKMMNYYSTNQKKGIEPNETLDWKKKTLEEPDGSNVGKYKSELDGDEIDLFNDLAKTMLRKFDYAL
jgi:hypothetical protein